MSAPANIYQYKTLPRLVTRLRDDLNSQDFVLLYAYNGTGKTRISMAFKEKGKQGGDDRRDTLYFNAFTEDLFYWDNDLENDAERKLRINAGSNFFRGLRELALEERIAGYLRRYASFDFEIDYENWAVSFTREDNRAIKVSRGEENIFIWCFFLAICELAADGDEAYGWVKYFYIDDPISSLDDNNAIAVACDLATLLRKGIGRIKTVISSHHTLFFNVMCNELKKQKTVRYFLHRSSDQAYTLRKTNDTPYFHHVATLSELKRAIETDKINTYHFNTLRSILEKTSSFFGFNDFGKCIHGIEDEVLFDRALNLLSHGAYSVYEPVEMGEDNKNLLKRIFQGFLEKYQFHLPEILTEETKHPL